MTFLRIAWLLTITAALCPAQMTRDQKAADFSQLAAVYAINYGPVQWKRDALQVDVLHAGDWLLKAMNTADDLDFYEVCVAYVAQLNDAHDAFLLPSDFEAWLGFTADIYDGKVLIDSIDKPGAASIQVGDEILAMDGVPVQEQLDLFQNYAISGNSLSTRRVAAAFLTYRPQALMPHAHTVGDSAAVLIKRTDGDVQMISIPWNKAGAPVTLIGPVISPFHAARPAQTAAAGQGDYMRPLARLRNMRIQPKNFVRGFGIARPVFDLPDGFVTRLGKAPFDFFYSGTFSAQGLRIGYIRIPSFEGGEYESADFQAEIEFMQQNTDVLVVDVMRNPGGDGCFAEDLLRRVHPVPFRTIGLEIRATRSWVADYLQSLENAMAAHADTVVIQQLQDNLSAVQTAFHQPSGRTAPLPVCGPSMELEPAQNAYTKPILLLTDEFTASAGDLFAAVLQDNGRALLFGNRTMGAGGNVNAYNATTYSEGSALVTESLMSRKAPVTVEGFPTTSYIENVGVRPNIQNDFMTLDNLQSHGTPFVQAFTAAIVSHVGQAFSLPSPKP